MSVYFVYRSHSDNPSGFHVKVFPQDTVLEWFQSIWVGIPRTEESHLAREHVKSLIGRRVYSFGSLFERIHERGWPKPKSMTTAMRQLRDAMYIVRERFGQHHIQLLTHEELEEAVYIFDDQYAKKNPHRAAFLLQEDWRLPDAASEEPFKPKGAPKAAKLVHGAGASYFAHFAAYDTGSLTDLPNFGLCGVVAGVRVADFPRYLFALRNRIAANADDETLNREVRDLVTGLDAIIKKATGDEKAFLTALTANPDDYACWCAYCDWRMENDKPLLLEEIFRRYEPYHGYGANSNLRRTEKDEMVVQTHIAQASKHIAQLHRRDHYHHFVLFDDEWANAHRDLAASILRTASRWDPL